MANKSEFLEVDLFNMKPVPGESLTQEPGLRPYERPPQITDIDQAFGYIANSTVYNPRVRGDVMDALDMGMSVETIVSALVLNAFTEGVFTPDLAEIIKPPLIQLFTQIASEEGIEDLNVVNVNIPKETNDITRMDIMKNLNPKKFERLIKEGEENDMMPEMDILEEEEQDISEGFIDRREVM